MSEIVIGVFFVVFMIRIFIKLNSAKYKGDFTKNSFLVENVKAIKNSVAVCTCGIGAIWLLFIWICEKSMSMRNIIPTLIFTVILIVAIYFSMSVANWCLIVEGKEITYINWRGKVTHYNFDKIKVKITSNLTIKIYSDNCKVFVVDNNMKNWSCFMRCVDDYEVEKI